MYNIAIAREVIPMSKKKNSKMTLVKAAKRISREQHGPIGRPTVFKSDKDYNRQREKRNLRRGDYD